MQRLGCRLSSGAITDDMCSVLALSWEPLVVDAEELQPIFIAACEDAGIAPTDVLVFPFAGKPASGLFDASFIAPGEVVFGQEVAHLESRQRGVINDDLTKPRLTLRVDPEPPVVAGKLRHELEHVRQWQHVPDGRRLFVMYDAVLNFTGDFVGEDRRASAVLYNIIPFESDANAAAQAFTERVFGSGVGDPYRDGEYAVLFRAPDHPADVTNVATAQRCARGARPGSHRELSEVPARRRGRVVRRAHRDRRRVGTAPP